MLSRNRTKYFIFFIVSFGLLNWQCLKSKRAGIPAPVVNVVAKANLNKPELMNAIGKYLTPADSLKLKAMYWLIANMYGNYTVYYSIQDSMGRYYSFPPENFSSYLELKHRWDSTEQQVGNLIYHADSFALDYQQLKADFLIKNMDEAWRAHQFFPWSKSYDFQTFCRWILSYRCANEVVKPFREHFLKEYIDSVRMLKSTNPLDVALLLNRLVNRRLGYKDTYNKEVNVQSINQLEHAGSGNFYDINVYKVKVLRSFGIAAALDYTPFLADSNFGYAWTTVILPDHSELSLEFSRKVPHLLKPGRLAKVYRRTFERDTTSLYAIKSVKKTTPPFLGHYYYRDISNQLNNKNLTLDYYPGISYAYLAVFNDGEWHPIDWSRPNPVSGTEFHHLGTDVVYLPVSLKSSNLMRLGSPFIFDEQGRSHRLIADFSSDMQAQIILTDPYHKMSGAKAYTLYVWTGNWKPLYNFRGNPGGVELALPANGLFLLSDDNIDFNERIFVVDKNGRQQFY